MTFTNLFMLFIAFAVAIVLGEFFSGVEFIMAHPELLIKVVRHNSSSVLSNSLFSTL